MYKHALIQTYAALLTINTRTIFDFQTKTKGSYTVGNNRFKSDTGKQILTF